MRRAMWFAIAMAIVPMVPAGAAITNVTVGPGLSFTPPSVTVAPGDTVVWTFAGFHTTTSDSPPGAEVWDSGIRGSGTFSHTFTTPGTYPYYCSLHSFPGGTFMNGSVQVTGAPPPPPAPTLTSVSPSSGTTAGGTAATLTGTNFDSSCTVDFGGAAGSGVSAPNANTINATTPGHAAGPVPVSVTCTGGTATLTNGFTFDTPPGITSVTPLSALPGATITITGVAFQNGATVSFRGTASPTVTFVNATSLQAVVPNIASGAATIVVTNPDTLNASFTGFTVSVPAPTLTSVVPSNGTTFGGTAVTLTGTNFAPGCTADFGGAAATGVSAPSATTINATTPAHAAGAVTVSVTCSGGTATLSNGFTFNTAPVITSVIPNSALAGATVTITGSGFQNGATVSFRGTASPTVTFVNATTLQAVVPNIANGAATIVVMNPDTLSGSFTGFAVTSLAIPTLSRELLLLLALALAAVVAMRTR